MGLQYRSVPSIGSSEILTWTSKELTEVADASWVNLMVEWWELRSPRNEARLSISWCQIMKISSTCLSQILGLYGDFAKISVSSVMRNMFAYGGAIFVQWLSLVSVDSDPSNSKIFLVRVRITSWQIVVLFWQEGAY